MAIFFQFSTTNDVIVVEELLLKKYDINYIKKMSISHGIKFVDYCFEKDLEEALWPMYISDRERMDKDNFITFKKYVDEFINPQIAIESTDVILNEIEAIKKEMEDANGSI